MKSKSQFIIFVIFMGLISGCGEGFRGNTLLESENSDSPFFDEQGNRNSLLDASDNDLYILESYSNELVGQKESTEELTNRVEAFDMFLSAKSETELGIQARLMISCDETYSFESEININQLKALQVIKFDRQGDYEVEIQCSSESCQEMVAGIRKYQGDDRGLVLVGLGIGGQGGNKVLFVSRNVDYSPHFASFESVADYGERNSCEFEDGAEEGSFWDQLKDSVIEKGKDEAVEVGKELLDGWIQDTLDDIF